MKQLMNAPQLKPRRRELRRNQTKEEALLWQAVRNSKLGVKIRRQVSVGPFIVDFYCSEKQLAIEVDGSQHYTEEGLEYDRNRTAYLNSVGIQVVRFTNNEVSKNLRGVLDTLLEKFKK